VACLAAAVLAPVAVDAEELLVFAASSLTNALQGIGAVYERSFGHTLVLNFGASNDLARQIQAGAPADVFFSADVAQMDALERAGLVSGAERLNVLSNTLVAVLPIASTSRLVAAADLVQVRRLALADPQAVPAGIYARQYLVSLGLWDALSDRVVPMLNVRAALAAVESENVDAGIVYRTDVALSKRVRVAFSVPPEAGPRIVYPLAPIAASRKQGKHHFVRYLVSAAAAEIFEQHGFALERSLLR